MLEIFLVLLTLGSFLAVAYAPWVPMLQLGAGLAALGMLVGVPAGLLSMRSSTKRHCGGSGPPSSWAVPASS